MSDEFDDATEPASWRQTVAAIPIAERSARRAPRLIARIYVAANRPLKARLLACLLRPLGPLGLAAIAAGAFASFLTRTVPAGFGVAIEDAARFSSAQIMELALFVEQVNPQALQQYAKLVADNPLGVAAFSASAVALLIRALQGESPEEGVSAFDRRGRPRQDSTVDMPR